MTINVKNANVAFASTFSLTSTSYTDLLDGAAGSIISVTITKEAGTNIFVRACASCIQNATADTLTLGVHDGTTTTDIAKHRGVNTSHGLIVGVHLFTGLGAGAYTFKLRVKLTTGNQCDFTVNHSAFLTAMEVPA